MVTKINMSGSNVGAKALCAVTDPLTLEVLPLVATDNLDGTSDLNVKVTSAALPTGAATEATLLSVKTATEAVSALISGGKLPVDASVSIDAIDIGDVDIKEFPSVNLGQQQTMNSLSVAPATDIVDATYIGDIKFGESVVAGTNIIGKVGIDQTTDGTTNRVVSKISQIAGENYIEVSKKLKGTITIAHNAITGTATSSEINCIGFNSLLVHWVSDMSDKTWTISIQGAMGTGLTFVPLLDKATGLVASEITTDISGFFVISNIPDFIKIVATETDDGATCTCKVQPFNV